MTGYCKAYRLQALQSFPEWNNVFEHNAISDNEIYYLHDDYIVRNSPIRREKIVFQQITSEWKNYCHNVLHFAIPEQVLPFISSDASTSNVNPTDFFPFTSGQQWLIEELSAKHPSYYNVIYFYPFLYSLPFTSLVQIIDHLANHHDALRTHMVYQDNTWHQFVIEKKDMTLPLMWLSFSHLTLEEQQQVIRTTSHEMQYQINSFTGPLWYITFFESDLYPQGATFGIINHFITDQFSNFILQSNFQMLYKQSLQNDDLKLPPPTTSFKQWAWYINTYIHSPEAQQEVEQYWQKLPWHLIKPFPLDFPEACTKDEFTQRPGYGTYASGAIITRALERSETTFLLKKGRNKKMQVEDVLLTALVQTLTDWTNTPALFIFVQNNGRQSTFQGTNLTHTIGYIAHARRLFLDLQDSASLSDLLIKVRDQIRQAPNNGRTLDWILRRGDGEKNPVALQAIPFADIHFHFHGTTPLANDDENTTDFLHNLLLDYSQTLRNHVFTFDIFITKNKAHFFWGYSQNLHRRSTIEQLMESFMTNLRVLFQLIDTDL